MQQAGDKTVLVEAIDLPKEPSRSTKLVHGGVCYLEQRRYSYGKRSFERKRINGSKCSIT
jgi:glycerol-3-phosphate dehydrogenase